MSPWLFNVYMDTDEGVKNGKGRRGVRVQENRLEFKLPGL